MFCGCRACPRSCWRCQLGIERRERPFDAEDRIGFDDRRFVHGDCRRRLRGQAFRHRRNLVRACSAYWKRARPVCASLCRFPGRFSPHLRASNPTVVALGIADGERRRRIVDLRQAAGFDIRILDVGGHSHVVRQIAVLEEVERLCGRTAGGHACGEQQATDQCRRLNRMR